MKQYFVTFEPKTKELPMKTLALLAIITLFLFPKTYAVQLSSEAKISLLTCAPGDEIYSYFGHSAVRINDPQNGIDFVFNYGILVSIHPISYGGL